MTDKQDVLAEALRELSMEMANTRLFQIEAMGEQRIAAKIQGWSVRLANAAVAAHESARVQPASVADDWNPSVAEVAAWTVRNGLDGVLVPSEARTAIDDARSMHMLAPQPPSAMAQESGDV